MAPEGSRHAATLLPPFLKAALIHSSVTNMQTAAVRSIHTRGTQQGLPANEGIGLHFPLRLHFQESAGWRPHYAGEREHPGTVCSQQRTDLQVGDHFAAFLPPWSTLVIPAIYLLLRKPVEHFLNGGAIGGMQGKWRRDLCECCILCPEALGISYCLPCQDNKYCIAETA